MSTIDHRRNRERCARPTILLMPRNDAWIGPRGRWPVGAVKAMASLRAPNRISRRRSEPRKTWNTEAQLGNATLMPIARGGDEMMVGPRNRSFRRIHVVLQYTERRPPMVIGPSTELPDLMSTGAGFNAHWRRQRLVLLSPTLEQFWGACSPYEPEWGKGVSPPPNEYW